MELCYCRTQFIHRDIWSVSFGPQLVLVQSLVTCAIAFPVTYYFVPSCRTLDILESKNRRD